MSAAQRYAEGNQYSRRPQLVRLGYVLTIVFTGTLTTGILVAIGFSASGCFLSRVIRCFSISRDAVGVTLFGLKVWSLPALIAALLVTAIMHVRGFVVWWNVLVVALVSMLGSGIVLPALGELTAPSLLWFTSLVLFVGVQLSRLVSKWFGGSPI